jgi:hypothetical protein
MLQVRDLLAQGRLCNPDALGGAGKVQLLSNSKKISQLS